MEIGDTICMWSFMSAPLSLTLWFDGDLDRKCWQHIHMGSGRSVRQWEFLLEPPDLFYLVFGLLPWWLSIVCIEVGLEPRTCSYSVYCCGLCEGCVWREHDDDNPPFATHTQPPMANQPSCIHLLSFQRKSLSILLVLAQFQLHG